MAKVCSVEDRERFFALLCGGASVQAAAAAVGVARGTGTSWWQESGLMSPVIELGRRGGLAGSAPSATSRSSEGRRRRLLTCEDRTVIAVGLRKGMSFADIGALIGRDKSVVCREAARNRGRDGSYFGSVADRAAHERRRRPKRFKLVDSLWLCAQIEEWMDQGWSPGLIASVLRQTYPGDTMRQVSHETIYQALYVQSRGELRKDLYRQLSLKRRQRVARSGPPDGRGVRYKEALKISDRPAEVEDRAVPGHWEGDLILGPDGRSAGTLIERTTRFTILLHLPGRHDADSVAAAMIREMGQLPEHLRRSLTWDRGVELARYEQIQLKLQMPVYFCNPHSPWQRGTNENTNRLLRFWFEKGSDLSVHTAADLRRIAATLNARPRPTLGLKTPAQALNELLAQDRAA